MRDQNQLLDIETDPEVQADSDPVLHRGGRSEVADDKFLEAAYR
jgi:hypothetical protein